MNTRSERRVAIKNVDELYRRYGGLVMRRCRRMLRDEDAALDAMHDTFVELLRNRDRLHDEQPGGLLYRMATQVCLNRLRTQRRHPETPDEALLLSIATAASAEKRVKAARFLSRLFGEEKDSTAVIATLHHFDGLTLEQVASQVGMSVSGVRKRLRNLRARGVAMEEKA